MDNTLGSIKRISYLPDRASGEEQGDIIGGQNYWDVWITGGSLANVTLTDVTINGTATARTERIVTDDGDVTVLADDYVITMDKTSDEATTVILPDPTTTSRSLIIKDGKGDANTYNITLDPGGYMIDGGSSYTIDSAYGAVEIIFNGVEWNIINAFTNLSGNMVVGPVSSTNNALPAFNGTSGDTLKDTTAIYDGANLTLNGNVVYRAGGTDVPVADGGTGASTLTGYVKGAGTSPLTASATIPNTDITGLGTMSTQNANNVAITGGTVTGATLTTDPFGIRLQDQLGDHYMSVLYDEDATGNRQLAIRLNDSSRVLQVFGNTTLNGGSTSGSNTGDQTTSGTSNRITVTNGTTNPTIDIAATYVGQTSITTLGTVATGTWQGTAVGATFGGTAQTSWTTGDILYASGANTLAKRAIGTTNQVLTVVGGVPAYATPIFSEEFISSNQAVPAAGGLLTLAHGLSGRPKFCQLWLICTTAANGYSIGDEIIVSDYWTNGGTTINGAFYFDDNTNINLRVGSGEDLAIITKNTGASATPTTTNFAYKVKAWR